VFWTLAGEYAKKILHGDQLPPPALRARPRGAVHRRARVVFGDIGTSPLYTMQECLKHLPATGRTESILGVLSLMFWALMFAVNFKYITFVMRADNHGEGGVFALLALSHPKGMSRKRNLGLTTLVVMAGAALLYGDGVITPAITVLSSVEASRASARISTNLSYRAPSRSWRRCFIFSTRHENDRRRVWPRDARLVRDAGGARRVAYFRCSGVFKALNPLLGLKLLIAYPAKPRRCSCHRAHHHRSRGALCRHGAFRPPLYLPGLDVLRLPGLLLNYFGQGAHALAHPEEPMAIRSLPSPRPGRRSSHWSCSRSSRNHCQPGAHNGTYSLTRQAIQLGFFPRLKILHTNAELAGQIYVPLVNWRSRSPRSWSSSSFAPALVWRRPTASPSRAPWR